MSSGTPLKTEEDYFKDIEYYILALMRKGWCPNEVLGQIQVRLQKTLDQLHYRS